MLDYDFIDDTGRRIPVAEMLTVDIICCLQNGVELEPGETVRPPDIMARLQLELEIRQKGLRG